MGDKKIVYIDMDDVLCDFTKAFESNLKANPSIAYPQSQYGFFAKLDPVEGAIAAFNKLLNSTVFEPYVLTAPSTRNPLSYTEKRVWIEDKLGYQVVPRLILCANKSLLKGDYLIDDNHQGKGQEEFEGKLIHFGSKEFPHWKAVEDFLLS